MKGSHVERHVCGGAPLDNNGELRKGINDCPFEPTWVCMGLMVGQQGQPVDVIILGCDLHSPAIVRVLAQWGDPEVAGRAEIAALDSIMEELGPDVHVLEPAAA